MKELVQSVTIRGKQVFSFFAIMMLLFSSSCKKEDKVLPVEITNETLLQQAKNKFASEFLNETNNFAKHVNLVPIWERAITGKDGNMRVPLSFSLKTGKKAGIIDDSFELYVKNVDWKATEVSIIHFLKIGNNYHSEVINLSGGRVKNIILERNFVLSQNIQQSSKSGKSVMTGGGTESTNLIAYFSLLYDQPVQMVVLQHCPEGLLFNIEACYCDYPEDAGEDATDEFFLILFMDGTAIGIPAANFLDTVIIFPEPVFPEPQYPNEPAWPNTGGSGGGGYFPPSYGGNNGSTSFNPSQSDLNNSILIPDGNAKISDITKYLNCFNDGKVAQSYTLTIYVDQPVANTNDWFALLPPNYQLINPSPQRGIMIKSQNTDIDVGHTFVTFEKNNIDGTNVRQTLGFYPDPSGSGVNSKGVIKDNGGHAYDLSFKLTVTSSQFNLALQNVSNDFANKQYVLSGISGTEYNCTDAAISWMNSAGAGLPSITPRGYFMNTPGDFGQALRQKQGVNKNPNIGIPSKGPCN